MTDSINFKNLDLNLLRVLDAIMAEKSLTRAAQTLSLTQPAVSNALRRLRTHLKDPLLKRTGQFLQPTPLAKALWPQVRGALQQLETALNPQPFDPLQTTQAFIVAMADATAAELIPGFSKILELEAPQANLRVIPLTTRDPRKLLLEEEADLAVGYFPAVMADLTAQAQVGESRGFEHERLFEGEYVCVMRRSHPLSHQPMSLDEFCNARHMLVSFSGRPFGFVDQALASMGRVRRVVVTVNQFSTAGRVVLNSDLITVLPKHFVRVAGLEEQLSIQPLPLAVPPVHIDLLWLRHARTLGAHEWLKNAMQRSAAEAVRSF
jgi:DNA-binding transcriptional LysR family regulator